MTVPQRHYRTCPLCEAMCGLEIEHDGEKVLSIRGDKKDPFSQGHVCPKAVALQDVYEDPDRLRAPLEKTPSGWREVSWTDALDKVAAQVKSIQETHGRDAVGVYLGNPNVHNLGSMLRMKDFLYAIGSKNRFSATSVDQLPHQITAFHLFGHQLRIPIPDIDRTDHLLIFGGNPLASNGSIMTAPNLKKRLRAIMQRGGKVVVVDPRRTETARIASEHHFVRPGTDAFLLLAMIQVMFAEQKVNLGRLSNYIDDLGPLEGYVRAYTPESVASITGVPAGLIRQITTDFCDASKPVCYGRMGVSVQRFGLLCQYLVVLINILRGRLDSEGGAMFTQPALDIVPQTGRGSFGRRHTRVRGLPEFAGEFPASAMVEEITTPGPGQIKAMVTVAANPVLTTPNGSSLGAALDSLDFMVAIDPYLNETTRHADIILPPVSPLEREHCDLVFQTFAVRNVVKFSPALFKPPADAKQDWEIFVELQRRLNPPKTLRQRVGRAIVRRGGLKVLLRTLHFLGPYGGLRPKRRVRFARIMKAEHGLDLGALQPCLPQALFHKDKKIHLHLDFYMKDLARLDATRAGHEMGPDRALLIGRRHVRDANSWLHNCQRLVKGESRCTVLIHPKQASQNGFRDGQRVRITSRTGAIELAAKISDEIMPGVVSVPHGWGHGFADTRMEIAKKHAGVSVNDLTDDQLIDELSGNAALNGVPVRLSAAD